MARPLRIHYPGAFYHVFARGNARQAIIRDAHDPRHFLRVLTTMVEQHRVTLHAYCLMPNHYHLLLATPEANLSQALHYLNGVYTQYFNRHHRTVGHLFQGRFKALLVEIESYGLELSRYIHLNPVKAQLVARPAQYRWSSYRAYMGIVKTPDWLDTRWTLGQFGRHHDAARQALRRFTMAGLKQEYEPFEQARAQVVLGSEAFLSRVEQQCALPREDREMPAVRQLRVRPTADALLDALSEACHTPREQLLQRGWLRAVALYALRRYQRATLRELATLCGISLAGVSRAVRRVHEQQEQPEIKRLLRQTASTLKSKVKI